MPVRVSPPRSLEKLLKQAEKAVQVYRRAGLDRIVAELGQHRAATQDPVLHAALDRLCDVVTRFSQNPSQGMAADLLVSVEAVKRACERAEAARADPGRPATKKWFRR